MPNLTLRLHKLMLAASLLVPAGLFSAAALHNRAEVLREGQDALTRTTSVMDEHARKVFETGDLVLGRLDDRIHNLSWSEISAPETSAFLAQLKARLEQVVSIWVTDAQGMVRAGSQSWDPVVTIASRDFFQAQRERDAGTYVSAPFRGKATQTASFAVSRRRSTSDGRFDGIIHIALSPDYFAHYYASTLLGSGQTATLLRADGVVIARTSPHDIDVPLPTRDRFKRRIAQTPQGGSFVSNAGEEGRERAYAYRAVGTYPLYVVFRADIAAMLSRWHANLAVFGAVAGVASLMLLLMSWMALRGVQSAAMAMAQLTATMDELQRETAQREAAEQRVRQVQKMEAVGQLTGGIAHDFNNLLMAILGSMLLLRKRLPAGDDRALRLLDNAVQGAQRGASLTQRLLAFSRGQALKPDVVHIPELVRGMAELLRSSMGAIVQVETSFPPALAPAYVDANQLELALLNLAVNARDAMPEGGLLTISGRDDLVSAGQLTELPPGHYVVLSVIDNGEGMDEATLARCMEPFFTTKGVGKGTGLGLSMVYGLAAQSGGRLVLHSRQGEGTTAELWLPRAEARQAMAAQPNSALCEERTMPRTSCTVLLVDDDPLVLASTTTMLEDLGHAVVAATSGREAMDILRAGAKVDLVVTDQAMPGMTGLQLASQLQLLHSQMPVMLITGYADRTELTTATMPLLYKPFSQSALEAAIQSCLSERQRAAE
ncbi:response regulator [Pseudoroseomonas wenyumeiae]|uniref:histidine kinase n=2 Tax=Teichococcus wenyumeiae TaxID=2478470 RepID=A0A3A9JSY9_9PROT|nr:response regulator [Pseudoroseomonas wenyumeiae]RKK03838.1 response regulator [Pseudoroseomonas wenyumeiae]RMI16920.1 response regulator [Pseudoroseomonas wenyumeiae]